jgi:hypothetical protein
MRFLVRIFRGGFSLLLLAFFIFQNSLNQVSLISPNYSDLLRAPDLKPP